MILRVPLAGFGQTATAALGLIPDLLDEALVALDAELDDDVDEEVEKALDVRAGEFAPGGALLDEKHELLERELAAAGMHACDRAGVSGVDVAQIVEGFFRAQLREQDPV